MKTEIHANDEQSKRNVETVLALYDEMINQHSSVEAVKKYLRPDYIQHNPLIQTGAEALGKFFEQVATAFPRLRVVVHNVIAVDNYVWAHINFLNITNNDPDDRGLNGVDIFRFDDDGLIRRLEAFLDFDQIEMVEGERPEWMLVSG